MVIHLVHQVIRRVIFQRKKSKTLNDNDNDIDNDNEPIISSEDSSFDSMFDDSSVINVNTILAKKNANERR